MSSGNGADRGAARRVPRRAAARGGGDADREAGASGL